MALLGSDYALRSTRTSLYTHMETLPLRDWPCSCSMQAESILTQWQYYPHAVYYIMCRLSEKQKRSEHLSAPSCSGVEVAMGEEGVEVIDLEVRGA